MQPDLYLLPAGDADLLDVCRHSQTSSSWLNLVERLFREPTEKAIRPGVFSSAPELVSATQDYFNTRNSDAKTFTWTAGAEDILGQRPAVSSCPEASSTLKVQHCITTGRKRPH